MAKLRPEQVKILQTHYTILEHELLRGGRRPYDRGAMNELTTIIQQLGGKVENGVVSFSEAQTAAASNVCPNCGVELDHVYYTDYGRKIWVKDQWEQDDSGEIDFSCPNCNWSFDYPALEKLGVL